MLDALPVQWLRFCSGVLLEAHVRRRAGGFELCWHRLTDLHPLLDVLSKLDSSVDYEIEYSPWLSGWVHTASDILQRGAMLLSDYGYARQAYYHPAHNRSTLRSYYRHRVHDDVLAHVGLQDITAHVDFRAVAEAARAATLTVAGYTEQAQFLLNLWFGRAYGRSIRL